MASFLGSIISSKDNPAFVLSALQLVELLTIKLPEVYQTSFLREGVVFEIEALAEQELTTAKAIGETVTAIKTEPEDPIAGPSATATTEPVDTKPLILTSGLPNGLSAFLADSAVVTTPKKTVIDPNDANILRARVLGAKKIFDLGGDHKDAATMVLDALSGLVKRLCVAEATEPELRDTLRDIASQFSEVGQNLSSFELLKSGLVDGFLEFVDIDGAVSSADRRAIFFDIFSDTTLSNPSPLTMLVKRLHESLGRLEDFEVETAFNGVSDSAHPSSSSLGRSMRIKLQAEGQDMPKQVSSLSLTIQAIAPMQALHDYLRPRVADGNFGSGLSTMFAAYSAGMAIPRTGAGSSTSRLLTALNSGHGTLTAGPATASAIASSAPASNRLPIPPPSEIADNDKPQRRRSARISGQGMQPPAESTLR